MEVFCFIPVESLSQRRSRKEFMSRRSKSVVDALFQGGFVEAVAGGQNIRPFPGRLGGDRARWRWKESRCWRALFQDARRCRGRRRWRCRRRARGWWPACAAWWFFRRRWLPAGRRCCPGWQVKLTLSTAEIWPRFLSWKCLDKPRASIIPGPRRIYLNTSRQSVLRDAGRKLTGAINSAEEERGKIWRAGGLVLYWILGTEAAGQGMCSAGWFWHLILCGRGQQNLRSNAKEFGERRARLARMERLASDLHH